MPFVFLELNVMTQLSAQNRHDDMFLQEQYSVLPW
jgi:hypothetical protein